MPSKILVVDENLAASKLAESVLAQHFNGGDVMVAQRATDGDYSEYRIDDAPAPAE